MTSGVLTGQKENVYDRFRDLGIKVHQIVGNHDAYYKNTNDVNSIESLLREYDNIVPISGPGEYNVGGCKTFLIPWISAENREETLEKMSKTKAKSCIWSPRTQRIRRYPGNVQHHGMETDVFDKFNAVYSGHYHTRSNDGKIFYISVIHTNSFGMIATTREDLVSLIQKRLNLSLFRIHTLSLRKYITKILTTNFTTQQI